MERVSVLCLLLLLCSLLGAEPQDIEVIEQRKASLESANVAEQSQLCPPDVHAVLREMSAKLAKHEVKIEQLQTLNQEQAAKLKELEKQTSHVDALKLQQKEQAVKVDTLKQQQQEQLLKMKEVDTLKIQQMEQAAKLKEQTSEVDTMKLQQQAGQVAFSASLVTSGPLTLGPFNTETPVIFRRVVTNIGNAYNQNTGFFTAPVKGAYHFEVYIICHMDGSVGSGFYLVQNGGRVVGAYERQGSGWGSFSNGATLLLEAGEVVFVQLRMDTRIYDDDLHYSTFSGHLLFPM